MLESPSRHRLALVIAYYNCLSDDSDFKESLASLFERLDVAELPDGREGRYSITELLLANQRKVPPFSGDYLRRRAEDYRTWMVPGGVVVKGVPDALDALASFIDRWPLPSEGASDVWQQWEVHDWNLKHGFPPPSVGLGLGTRSEWMPTPGLPAETGHTTLGLEGFSGGLTVNFVENQPWIFPNVPLPFRYDPTRQSRHPAKKPGRENAPPSLHEILDRICDEIRQSVMAQAGEYDRQVTESGWRPPRPYQDWDHLCWRTRLVFSRAVKKLTWSTIRLVIPHPNGKRRSRSYVIEQAEATASILGISLA